MTDEQISECRCFVRLMEMQLRAVNQAIDAAELMQPREQQRNRHLEPAAMSIITYGSNMLIDLAMGLVRTIGAHKAEAIKTAAEAPQEARE